jgi:hypothetical protein
MKSFTQKLMLTGMVLCVGLGLAACGKKAMPVPPDGSTFPRQYPKPQADTPKQP